MWDAIEDTPKEAENMKLRSALIIGLMSSDLLRKWTEDFSADFPETDYGALPELPEYGDLDLERIRDSVYAWF